jgi:hypothetical protein
MSEKLEPEKTESEPRHWLTPRVFLGTYAVAAAHLFA